MGKLYYREDAKNMKVFQKLLCELSDLRAFVVNDSLPIFATFAFLREILPDQFDHWLRVL